MHQIRTNKIFIFVPVLLIFIFYLSIHPLSTLFQLNTSKQNYSNTQVRIYCLILTSPQYFDTRARAVNSTWGPRCDGYSFISEYSNDTKGLPIAPVGNLSSGYSQLTLKTTLAFHYVYKQYLNNYDWFVKADDDTYLFIENLKLFLSEQNSSEPITFGYNFKIKVPGGMPAGGAAYVLSRESVKRFYQAHHEPNTTCIKDSGAEDIEIAKCLRTKGVYLGKSIDKYKRERFHHLSFASHFRGQFPEWFIEHAENKPLGGSDCCSDSTISFHYVTPDEQYLIDKVRYGFHGERS